MGNKVIAGLTNPFKFKFFLLTKLPLAWFAGLKVEKLNEQESVISLKYSWFTQNPFNSIYFAALNMAAELAPGSLCLVHTLGSGKKFSFLVVSMEAGFFKKAVGHIRFVCEDGNAISNLINQAAKTGEGMTLWTTATGLNEQNETVAVVKIQWSFKVKK